MATFQMAKSRLEWLESVCNKELNLESSKILRQSEIKYSEKFRCSIWGYCLKYQMFCF